MRALGPPALTPVLALAMCAGCATSQGADPTPVMASQAELARVRQAIAPCLRRSWVPPTKDRSSRVTLRWRLDEDGRLLGEPEVLDPPVKASLWQGLWSSSPAADAAIRAVRTCAPFRLAVREYHLWKQIVFTFDATPSR